MKKIVVVGCDNINMNYAFSLVNSNIFIDEIVLIDIDSKVSLSKAIDLSHSSLYLNKNIKIKAGSYMDCKDANIVVLGSLLNIKENVDDLKLIKKNIIVMKNVVTKIVKNGFKGIFLVSSFPVDIMTYFCKKYSNFSSKKVIGIGTMIDTARCKYLLKEKLNVSVNDMQLYIVGPHNDYVILWGSSKVGALDLNDLLVDSDLKQIEKRVKNIPNKIDNLNGDIIYIISSCLFKLTKAIINNENCILPVSAPYNGVYISMPAVIDKQGIKGVMKIKLTAKKTKKLEDSIFNLKDVIKNLEV